MNSIFPKINEIRYIAARNNAIVIGVSESKLDETSLQSKIQISNYESLRFDRKRNGGGVACYIRSDNGYLEKHFFPKEIEFFLLKFFCLKSNLYLLELHMHFLIKVTFLKL